MSGVITSAHHLLQSLQFDSGPTAILQLMLRLVGTALAGYLLFVLYEVVMIGRVRHPRAVGAINGIADHLLDFTLRRAFSRPGTGSRHDRQPAETVPAKPVRVHND